MKLPAPAAEAVRSSAALQALIRREIAAAGGWMSFARYMELALYAPGLGYYSGGSRKFGAAGDFVTAPQISALFGRALAAQVAQILSLVPESACVLEIGAGTGRLAADLLLELETLDALPQRYLILEVSSELAARQRETLADAAPGLLDRVEWLQGLPESFTGVIVGNEVLDAMPVHLVEWSEHAPVERGVALVRGDSFAWSDRPATGAPLVAAQQIATKFGLPSGYLIELALPARAWLRHVAGILAHGVVLLLDYGFPRREFYHPQRHAGTLMCHYRHHAHGDPFFLPGLQDITTHVDFTAVADALDEGGLDILGYTAQSTFLLNCGIVDRLSSANPTSQAAIRDATALQKLLSPAEMGELFKAIAAGRGLTAPLLGFRRGDRLHAL